MTDLKTYSEIKINEAAWSTIAPVVMEILCILVIYFSPEIKKGLTAGGIKTVSALINLLKNKFPKIYAKILKNKSLVNFISNYQSLIEEFVEYAASNDWTTRAIDLIASRLLKRIPADKIREIKYMAQ